MAKAALKACPAATSLPRATGQRRDLVFTRVRGWCSACALTDVVAVKVYRRGSDRWFAFCEVCVARMNGVVRG